MTGQPDHLSRSASSRPSTGPGLPESLIWVSGYHAAQLAAAALLLLLLTVTAFGGWPGDLSLLVQVAREWVASDIDWLLAALTGTATLGALFFMLPAAIWRIGPSPRAALGGHLPDLRHMVLLSGAVLPLGILSDELYRVSSLIVDPFWRWLGERLPFAAALNGSVDTVSFLEQQTASTAYPLLLVAVGLGPAIGEEVIFRGLIGRGLIARWGTLRGVLLTSVLFAGAHLSPAHAVATLPIALFLHVAYLATGSIWAPIAVHFLNNALAVTMMKYGLGQEVQVSMVLLFSAATYVTVTGALLLSGLTSRAGVLRGSTSQRQLPLLGADPAATAWASAFTPGWLTVAAGSGVLYFTCAFVAAATGGS